MIVDGLGDRPITDTGGSDVYWVGDGTIAQVAGPNVYSAPAIFKDAENGTTYYYGTDFHLSTNPSGSSVQASTVVSSGGPLYDTVNGPRTISQMDAELRAVGWPGGEDVVSAYRRTTGHAVTLPGSGSSSGATPVSHTSTSTPSNTNTSNLPTGTAINRAGGTTATVNQPTDPSQTPISFGITGDPFKWLYQQTQVLGVMVPNTALAAGAGIGVYMLTRKRRR